MSSTPLPVRWLAIMLLLVYLALLTKNILFKKGGFRYYRHYFNNEYKQYTVKGGWQKANTVPFHTIRIYKKGLERNDVSAEYNIWGNLVGFVPFGILLPLAIPFFKRWWAVIASGFLLSLGYETTQLLTGLGIWDVDDLMLNSAGVAGGFILFIVGRWLAGSMWK